MYNINHISVYMCYIISLRSLLSPSLLSQVVQATVDYQLWRDQGSLLTFDLRDIPLLAWLLVSVSPLLVVLVNEVVKLHEIRYERRQELTL